MGAASLARTRIARQDRGVMPLEDDLPTWVVVMFVLIGLFGIGAVLYIASQFQWLSRRSTKRTYAFDRQRVTTAALAGIQSLGYAVYDREDLSISYGPQYMSGYGAAVFPVVHLVMLDTGRGTTQVEAVGRRKARDYMWNVMALSLLKELDERLA
jgi:hypothetical protein